MSDVSSVEERYTPVYTTSLSSLYSLSRGDDREVVYTPVYLPGFIGLFSPRKRSGSVEKSTLSLHASAITGEALSGTCVAAPLLRNNINLARVSEGPCGDRETSLLIPVGGGRG